MWDIILNPLITLLAWMYSLFGNNIILAIVALTVIIRMMTYPLLARQQRSSKKMQALQPRLKKLQEKYKDDREQLAQAQMKLYQEAGVNPIGGCLPLLVQFPILIGLYQTIWFALSSSPYQLIDLSERLLLPGLDALIPLQNTFMGMNLAQPPTPPVNPVYALVLPLLVMATTYVQSKVTMASTQMQQPKKDNDSGQPDMTQQVTQSMTTVMPIMFGMISLSFSVGLSVYFITSNVISIIQYSPMGKRVLDRAFGQKADDDDAVTFSDDDDEADEAEVSEDGEPKPKPEKKLDKPSNRDKVRAAREAKEKDPEASDAKDNKNAKDAKAAAKNGKDNNPKGKKPGNKPAKNRR